MRSNILIPIFSNSDNKLTMLPGEVWDLIFSYIPSIDQAKFVTLCKQMLKYLHECRKIVITPDEKINYINISILTNLISFQIKPKNHSTNIQARNFLPYISNLTALKNIGFSTIDIIDENLTYLSKLSNLESLFFFGTTVGNNIGEYLKHLSKLAHLYCHLNKITNCSSLTHLTNLQTLVLNAANINVSDLSKCTSLRELKIYIPFAQEGQDLLCLSNLTLLEELNISSCLNLNKHYLFTNLPISLKEINISKLNLTDGILISISNLTNLEILDCSDNKQITTISCIIVLTNLKNLNVKNTQITNIDSIKNVITKLEVLDVSFTNLSQETIDWLSTLTNLQDLQWSKN